MALALNARAPKDVAVHAASRAPLYKAFSRHREDRCALMQISKLINQSGFPLQLAIDRLVQDRSDQLGWKVVYREHGWRSPDGQIGFVDL